MAYQKHKESLMKTLSKVAAGLLVVMSVNVFAGDLSMISIDKNNSSEFSAVYSNVASQEYVCKLSYTSTTNHRLAVDVYKQIDVQVINKKNSPELIRISGGGDEGDKKADLLYKTSGLESLKECANYSTNTQSHTDASAILE